MTKIQHPSKSDRRNDRYPYYQERIVDMIERPSTAKPFPLLDSEVTTLGFAGSVQKGHLEGIDISHLVRRTLNNTIIVWEPSETTAYRRHGQATLSFGDPIGWIIASYFGSNFAQESEELPKRRALDSYSELVNVISTSKIASVLEKYEVPDITKTTTFLIGNLSLVDVLLQGHAALVHQFGSDTRFLLEVIPELDVASESYLRVGIETSLPVNEAAKKLDAFDKAWFFDQIEVVGSKLVFNLNFI